MNRLQATISRTRARSPRIPPLSAPVLICLILLIRTDREQEAVASPITIQPIAADTNPKPPPRLFRGRVLFAPEYLSRLLSASVESEALATTVPDYFRLAAEYARRYGIDEELSLQIVESAIAEGVDPELGFRLVRVESVFKPAARGRGGALGLTQLMPSTARAVDRNLRTEAQILEPRTNLRIGFRYLRGMLDRYDGDVRLALLAYNRGERAVDTALRAGRDPENGYSGKVLGSGPDRYSGPGFFESPD